MSKRKAISPLISFVLTILLVSVATTIVLTVIKPVFDRMSDSGTIDEATQNLELMNSAIKQVASESQGSKRTISLSVRDGEYGIDAAKDFIYYNYTTKTDFSLQGIIGDVRLDKSPVFIEYFNNYVENSNASPPWTIKNGTWAIESGEYSGQNGLAYYNYGTTSYFSLEGRITDKSGTNGEIFALPVTPNDLRGYWTFDEGSGNYSYDYSGFSNTGTLYSDTTVCSNGDCPTWTAGKFDYGLQFDGVDDYVDAGNGASLNITNAITLEAWVSRPSWSNPPDYSDIVGDQQHSACWLSMRPTEGTLSMHCRYPPGTYYRHVGTPYASLIPNKYYHIVGTYDGRIVKIYIDGVLKNTVDYGTVETIPAPSSVKISNSDYPWNGTIDEVKIYNRSLTANEIKSDYELGIKKLSSTGRTDSISASTNVYLVLSNPSGNTNFDEVKIKTNKRDTMLSIPYLNVDLNGTARFPKGNYQLTIEHMGINTTVNKPIVQLTSA